MNDITALMAAMKAAAEKATPGEWWSDVVETEGEYGDGEDRHSGYHSYAVYAGSESLLDMTNSTAACIHEEWDNDYLMAWDETAKRNAEFIAVASPDNVKTLVEALEKAQRANAAQGDHINQQQDRIDTLEKRNAELGKYAGELESRTVTVKLPKRYSCEGYHIDEAYLQEDPEGDCYDRDEVLEVLTAAGIKVIEGEQKNG